MKKGMTPEAVDQMAQQIQDAGEQAQQKFEQVKGRVGEFDWTGEDRDRYVSTFESEIGQMVQQLAQQAGELADRARQNAQAQRSASA